MSSMVPKLVLYLQLAGVLLLMREAHGEQGSGTVSGDDETSLDITTPEALDVRLVGGNSSSGEIQMYYIGEWYTFCREGFGHFEAQLACNQLGFPFVLDIYIITLPTPSAVFTHIDCSTLLQGDNKPSSLSVCAVFSGVDDSISGCSSHTTVGITCDDVHESSEGFVLIAFYSAFNFKLIAPDDDLYIDGLTIKDFFCSGVHLADRNNENVSVIIDIFISQLLLGTGGTPELGGLFPASSFGIDCNPVYGDLWLGSLVDGDLPLFNGRGELLVFNGDEWISVCADTFSYFEAQVACTQVFYPFFSNLYSIERSSYNTSQLLVESIMCNGPESSVTDCSIQLSNSSTQCTGTVGLTCDGDWLIGTTEGSMLIISEGNDVQHFTLIAPDDQYYLYNCSISDSEENFCPGVHKVNKSSIGAQTILNQLQTNEQQTCNFSGVNATDFDICALSPEPSINTPGSETEGASNTAATAGAVSGTIVIVITVPVIVVLLVLYQRHRKLKGKEDILSLVKLHGEQQLQRMPPTSPRNSEVALKHKPIRRHSTLAHARAHTDWEIPFACITLEEEVGSGAYGSIHRGVIACQHQDEPVDVAVKLLKRGAMESEHRALVMEIDMMKDIGCHRNVVSMVACCTSREHLALVMEYVPYGNLQSFLKKHRNEVATVQTMDNPYTPDLVGRHYQDILDTPVAKGLTSVEGSLSTMELIQYGRQITLGMEYLSSLKIVHRDLATRNILVGHDMILKVSDFGLSRDIYSDECYHMENVKDRLPVRWMAPESIVDRDFTTASDVWSFGVVVWEIITYASFPYFHMTNMEVIEKVNKGYRISKPEQCPDDVYRIMLACWQARPADRPSFAEIKKMLDSLLDTGAYTSVLAFSLDQSKIMSCTGGLDTLFEEDGDTEELEA